MSVAVRAAATVLPALPRGLGDRRAAQEVYRRLLSGRHTSAVDATIGAASMELSLDDWPQAQAYLLGRYDPSTVEFICDRLPADGVFVDGGSHVGLISLQVASRVKDASIHAFEPHPVKFQALIRNVQRNHANVTPNNVGLSSAAATLSYDSTRHAVNEDAASRIEVVALDAYAAARGLDRIDVMKLDIEGHELAALRGAEGLLSEGRIGAITMESMHGDTSEPMQMLEDLGYARVPMPDARPRWLSSRRPMPLENVGYIAPA